MLSPKTHLVARYLDLVSEAQRVTAENIANAETPGYRTRGLDFGAEMRRAMEDPERVAGERPAVREVGGLPVGNDGNDVALERELRALSENAIQFTHALLVVRGGVRSVRSAIQEGRGG